MSWFTPADEEEHRIGNLGYNVPDDCANCGQPFMEHNNGRCPTWTRHETKLAERHEAKLLANANAWYSEGQREEMKRRGR